VNTGKKNVPMQPNLITGCRKTNRKARHTEKWQQQIALNYINVKRVLFDYSYKDRVFF
jgi:hypothetical protein